MNRYYCTFLTIQSPQAKVDSLRDAHKLLERHIEGHTTIKAELASCQKQLNDQLEKYETLKEKFNETCKQRDVDEQAHRNTQEQWQNQVGDIKIYYKHYV